MLKKIPISWWLFFLFFIGYAALGYYLAITLETYHNDAISRTALGFFTVFGRDPHLAAVGFVWQPLPSLLQVPLFFILRPLGLLMFAGPLMTAFFGAFSVVYVGKIARTVLDTSRMLFSGMLAILFGTNPMIALYSAIGTSEMVCIFALLATTYHLVSWLQKHRQQDLLIASFFISLSFWARYESLPAFAGCTLLLFLPVIFKKTRFVEFESNVLQFVLPFLYSVGFWILINWLIMGNPLYFMNSPYSNASFTSDFRGHSESTFILITKSVQYVVERALYLSPILLALPFIFSYFLVKTKEKMNHLFLLLFLTMPMVAVLAFHVYQYYKGESFGWLRFYIYSIVCGICFAIYLLKISHSWLKWLVLLCVVAGSVTTFLAMNNPTIGREEYSFVQKLQDPSAELDFSRSYADQKRVVVVANTLPGKVLVDTDKGFAIPLFANQPEKFVITSDEDYKEIVENYPRFVDWVIVPQPASDDRGQNIIYTYYPGIWEGNAPFISLHQQIDGWKIFKVDRPNLVK